MVTEVNDETQVILEEMVRLAEKAEEPGDRPGTVVQKGSEDSASMVVQSVASAGYVWVYDTKTAEPSKINRNMLVMKLKQRRTDGSLVFTTIKPSFAPRRGTHKCLLHPSNPERERYDSLGFGVCNKHNLTSPMQVELHMRHSHKTEWNTIEQEKKEKERLEDRDLRNKLLTQVAAQKEKLPLYVSKKKK